MILFVLLVAQTDVLADEHRRAVNEDHTGAAVLTAWGGASIAAGVALAIAKREDKQWLTFGLFTAAVGAVNVGFGVLGLVNTQNERRTLADKLSLEPRDYQQELVARHRSGATIYALNFGLDISYVAAGVILWVVGERLKPNAVLHGMGMAGVIQGAWLLVFDLVHWVFAEQRGTVVARMRFSF